MAIANKETPDQPYQGLSPYSKEDADKFFGI